MKRIATAAAALLTLTGSLVATTDASAAPGRAPMQTNQRWDGNRDNGYMLNGRWNFGPPPASAMNQRGFQAGYHQWRRGDRLPSYFSQHYRQVDYRQARLHAPPRGYHYVRDDRGDTLLVGIATGVILSIIASH